MDTEQLTRIADEVQGHLHLGADQRGTVELYTRRLVNQLLIRCNRKDIPPGLEMLAVELVELMLRADNAVPGINGGSEDGGDEQRTVKSISRGDTKIEYADSQSTAASAISNVGTFLKDYSALLVKFVRPNIPRSAYE